MSNKKKFLDQAGVEYLWSKIDMQDYPNNETLIAVINAIDENKADKNYVDEQLTILAEKQADWSVNDPSDPRYVKNRTHYVGDPVETVLIPEQTVAFEVFDGVGEAESPVTIELVEGQTYTVNFDGVTYQCVCKMLNGDCPYIGSASNLDLEDTGEPFAYIYGDLGMWLAYNAGTEHTLSLSTVVSEIVKIPEKFLPDYDFAGKNVSNKTIMGYDGNEYVGGMYAEIFNVFTNKASGYASHAEGMSTTASGNNSHAEGYNTTASGNYSHAEGYNTTASADYSHAEGYWTNAGSSYQHVQGKCNIKDTNNKYAHIVGNGTSNSARSNAHTIDWEGNAWFAGDVYINSTSGINKDEGSKKLATEEYIDIRVPAWTDADEGKILQIVNGTPTWVSLPIAEEASF